MTPHPPHAATPAFRPRAIGRTAAGTVLLWAALVSCRRGDAATTTAPPDAGAPLSHAPTAAAPTELATVVAERVREHVAFLADDAQQGRAPGTASDAAVQRYVADAMKARGLQPAGTNGFLQPFEITDGVRLRADRSSTLALGATAIAHGLVPFSGESSAPVSAKLVFVGHGIAQGRKGSGDYEDLEKAVHGAIVVALAGAPASDPHISVAQTRAASKAITARDHGAVGFVLWDPKLERYPNHGEAADLGLPAVFVGTAGTPALFAALGGKAAKGGTIDPAALRRGRRSAKPATLETPIERVRLQTANVVGKLPGSGKSDRVVVVGAHMDHLGFGTDASLAPGVDAIHNGADDNASGVAVMLELCGAEAGRKAAARPFDVICIAFGAEEMGLLGSKHYVQSLPKPELARIAAMINFDMVGRLGPEGVVVAGAGTAKQWPELVEANRGKLTVRTTDDGYGPSDHGSFYEAAIPVLHFFTGPHEDYHKPSDDIDRLNITGAAAVGGFALTILDALQRDALVPSYIEVARPAQARGGGFRVSLGTIPDYGANVDGVRLSGVRKDGAAEKAGLRKGDVIVRIATRDIHNLDDYMASFAELAPGVSVPIVVVRDGKRVELQLVPQSPQPR
ncbi:MAG: M28 family peptidase [Nannocystaceae bacterium]